MYVIMCKRGVHHIASYVCDHVGCIPCVYMYMYVSDNASDMWRVHIHICHVHCAHLHVEVVVDLFCFIACDSSFFLLSSLLIVVYYARDSHAVRRSLFSGSEGAQFWPVVSRLAPSITISSVQDMEGIQTDLGRVRDTLLC